MNNVEHTPENYGLTLLEGVPLHPQFERFCGYEGERRYVGFYWLPGGDELMFEDGVHGATGSNWPWLMWTGHLSVMPHLAPFDFGSSDFEAKHWMLLDRERRQIWASYVREVHHFLKDAPDLRAERAAWEALPPEERKRIAEETRRAYMEAMEEVRRNLPSGPELMEATHRGLLVDQHNVASLTQWLDQQLLRCPSCGQEAPAGTYEGYACPNCGVNYMMNLLRNGLP